VAAKSYGPYFSVSDLTCQIHLFQIHQSQAVLTKRQPLGEESGRGKSREDKS